MAEEEQVMQPEEAEEGELDIFEAIRIVLKKASHADGLCRGLNETARAIDKGIAKVVLLAENCDLNEYKTLIKALCAEKDVPVMMVADRDTLGEWAGLCKIDPVAATARHVVKTSSVAITEVDEETQAWKVMSSYIQRQA